MIKNPSRFSNLVVAVTEDIKTHGYLYSGIYPDKMVEIGADLAVGAGRLTRNVERTVADFIQSLSFDSQVFIWSECFATRSEKDDLLNQLSNHITEGAKFNLFEQEHITATLCSAFTEAVLEKARIAYSNYQQDHYSEGSHDI
ncbi:hypothetical protein GO003_012670 [Methylicorpusculum oleiharenae]|uniref:hypothetical protein n=1 Tax=Methylicorpusculum oleiharenae TaxID=1338687 RepID=UPI00135B9062|nr:hypothetical protein [Methylicorpusculum oleiharenae]MCD2451247.1 hypothetical protein [Methylicorpusculum oleiharenae]